MIILPSELKISSFVIMFCLICLPCAVYFAFLMLYADRDEETQRMHVAQFEAFRRIAVYMGCPR